MATDRLTVVRVPGNGAEDVLIGPKGHIWTATDDGSVFRLTPDGHLVERVATTGGRSAWAWAGPTPAAWRSRAATGPARP